MELQTHDARKFLMHVSYLHLCEKHYVSMQVCETGIKLSCLLKCKYRYCQYLLVAPNVDDIATQK